MAVKCMAYLRGCVSMQGFFGSTRVVTFVNETYDLYPALLGVCPDPTRWYQW